jgi:hypothetical protein
MTEDGFRDSDDTPKKRTRRKPLSLHPMTEEEALRRVLGTNTGRLWQEVPSPRICRTPAV